jgi:hypothetical protein
MYIQSKTAAAAVADEGRADRSWQVSSNHQSWTMLRLEEEHKPCLGALRAGQSRQGREEQSRSRGAQQRKEEQSPVKRGAARATAPPRLGIV